LRRKVEREGVMRVDPAGKTLKGPFGYGSYRRRFWGREFEAAREKLIFATSCFDELRRLGSSP